VEPVAKRRYSKPSHRQLGLRMDKALEAALEASAARFERTLAQEARYALKIYLGLSQAPADERAERDALAVSGDQGLDGGSAS
jgi:hypothetical protein